MTIHFYIFMNERILQEKNHSIDMYDYDTRRNG